MAASNGVRGWPHLMPLWYLIRGEELWAWTYARSQKVRNLERDPRPPSRWRPAFSTTSCAE